ncbi:hypothetical protein FB451DRAFT_1397816 [Mycena latifolia]|nr:hypothetical protein FB451DRAFT_1397816 [Mycena latifolia]
MNLSNTTHLGFHPTSERDEGSPLIPRVYYHTPNGNFMTDDYVDDQVYSSHTRADLCLVYVYDVAREFFLGGERVTLPIVERVYRRDRHLCWSEIENVLRGGRIPPRYMATEDNETPMNPEAFRKYILHERSSGLPVEKQHFDFEYLLEVMLMVNTTEEELLALSPEQMVQWARKWRQGWHLDSYPRAELHWRFLHRSELNH